MKKHSIRIDICFIFIRINCRLKYCNNYNWATRSCQSKTRFQINFILVVDYFKGRNFYGEKVSWFLDKFAKSDPRKIFLQKFAKVYPMQNELQKPTWWKLKQICLNMPKKYQILPLNVIIGESSIFAKSIVTGHSPKSISEISRIFYVANLTFSESFSP